MIFFNSPDLENNSTCWDFKHNAKGENETNNTINKKLF